jgi:hypothetical protein
MILDGGMEEIRGKWWDGGERRDMGKYGGNDGMEEIEGKWWDEERRRVGPYGQAGERPQ